METVERVKSMPTGLRFDKILKKIATDMGFEYASFAIFKPISSHAFAFSTYPDEWQEHYVLNGYQQIDPAATIAARAIAPVDWSRLKGFDGYGEVFSAAHDFGIPDQGITIPVRGYLGQSGVLSVTASLPNRQWRMLVSEKITALQQQAAFLCDRTSGQTTPLVDVLRPQLSKMEIEVLQWVSTGMEYDEIAGRLGVSESLINIYLRSARTKLRVLSTPQAVGRAIMQKLISPV